MAKDVFHERLLAIITKLPGAVEARPWGSVHCKVDGKIFVGWGRMDDGEVSVGLRVDIDDQKRLVKTDPRFSTAKYVGRYGGVDMRIGTAPDWREVERYIVGSYRIIASKTRVKELDALAGDAPAMPTAAAKKPAARTKSTRRVAAR